MTEPKLEPLPDGVLEALRQVSTSTVATQLYKRGFRQPQLLGVRALSEVADGFVGEAFTMRFIPMREDVDTLDPYRSGNTLQWEALESVPPGHVLVFASSGNAIAASGGDMLMTRAWKRGAAAVMTDGGLRDGHVLAKLPFPTYARTVTITMRATAHHVADCRCPSGAPGRRSTRATCWSATGTGTGLPAGVSGGDRRTGLGAGEARGLREQEDPRRGAAGGQLPAWRGRQGRVQGLAGIGRGVQEVTGRMALLASLAAYDCRRGRHRGGAVLGDEAIRA